MMRLCLQALARPAAVTSTRQLRMGCRLSAAWQKMQHTDVLTLELAMQQQT
jgi:hypothetical protein